MRHPSTRQKLQYHFENTLSRGSSAVIAWLAVISLVIIVLAALLIILLKIPAAEGSNESWGFAEAVWNSLMRAMDAGNLAGDSGWSLRTISLVVTIGGLFIVATLISAISAALENAITEIRKGKSLVIEKDHTLILGWNSKIFNILSELTVANENRPKARIVILADKDKVEMEDEIRSKFPSTSNTRIVCRTGSPLDLDHLKLVSIHEPRSIIVLAPEETEQPDIFVIKSILAITNLPERREKEYHIVAELQEKRNWEAAKMVGGKEASLLLSSDIIAKLMAQTCRQSGLSVVYTELLDFTGSEIYFIETADLLGLTYKELLHRFEDSTVIGILNTEGVPHLNPPMDRVYMSGEKIIAIAEDDDKIIVSSPSLLEIDFSLIVDNSSSKENKENILIMGWNSKTSAIIRELDSYVSGGSELLLADDNNHLQDEMEALASSLTKLKLKYQQTDIVSREAIEQLNPTGFDHVIVLSNDLVSIQESDARTLLILLHLRRIADLNGTDLNIVSEMRDLRNRTLAEIAKADDFIVSDSLTSSLIAQISENKSLEQVFQQLLSSEGAEIYMKPIGDYVKTGVPIDFYTLLEAASLKGQTAIGYRLEKLGKDSRQSYGVNCNPVKSNKITFDASDKLIVLSES